MTILNEEQWAKCLRKSLGIPEEGPSFAIDRLRPREQVDIVLNGEEPPRVASGIATGRTNSKGEHIIWYRDRNGRKWRLELPWYSVLKKEE